jgi:hypothetical protein
MDRTKVSFAEAEERARYPAILKWGELDQRLRSALWTPIYFFLDDSTHFDQYSDGPGYSLRDPAQSIMLREFVNRQHQFVSDYKTKFSKDAYFASWRNFFKSSDYIEFFDFITFFVRDRDCPKDLIKNIAEAMDEPFSPYRLSIKARTVFPAIGVEETNSLEKDIDVAFSSPFLGSKAHIQAALDALCKGDYRGTVRESIHAVESAVKDFTDDTSATLSKAVKSLVGENVIHKALADAFDKLYAYTSDEKGIRHALVFGDNEKVGLDEAIFFLSACTAFVGFLSRKRALKS